MFFKDKLKSILATLEEIIDPESRKALKEAKKDIARDQLYSYKDTFGISSEPAQPLKDP